MVKISKDLQINDSDKTLNKLLSIKLLWENKAPSTPFNAQKISLDLSKCTFVILEIFRYPIANNHRISTIVFQYMANEISYGDYDDNQVRNWNRTIDVSPTGVTFGNATINGGTDNNALIPIRIFCVY